MERGNLEINLITVDIPPQAHQGNTKILVVLRRNNEVEFIKLVGGHGRRLVWNEAVTFDIQQLDFSEDFVIDVCGRISPETASSKIVDVLGSSSIPVADMLGKHDTKTCTLMSPSKIAIGNLQIDWKWKVKGNVDEPPYGYPPSQYYPPSSQTIEKSDTKDRSYSSAGFTYPFSGPGYCFPSIQPAAYPPPSPYSGYAPAAIYNNVYPPPGNYMPFNNPHGYPAGYPPSGLYPTPNGNYPAVQQWSYGYPPPAPAHCSFSSSAPNILSMASSLLSIGETLHHAFEQGLDWLLQQ